MRRLVALLAIIVSLACIAGEDKPDSGRKGDAVNAAQDGPRTERVKEKDGTTTELIYDRHGNVTIRTVNLGTPKEGKWLYTYSETGQKLSEEAPNGARTLYEYETLQSKEPKRMRVLKPDGSDATRG